MRDMLFNEGWLFHYGADPIDFWQTKTLSYSSAKTQSARIGFAAPDCPDSDDRSNLRWKPVTLPHDYLISQDSNPECNETLGFFEYGDGCYRKHFTLDEQDAEKRITLYFEGIASTCKVYLNGCLLGENKSAYNSFEYELNPYAKFGEENVLAVLVGGRAMEGWWYAGAGIVRDVWLRKTEKVSVERDGIYVRPIRDGGNWKVPGEIDLRNDDTCPRTVNVRLELEGLAAREESVTLAPECVTTVKLPIYVESAHLWDTEDPYLYTARVTVSENGAALDSDAVRTGFRTAEFRPDGFYLNGKRTRIKGVCCHEDYSITGRAVPYAVKELRLMKLKECGVNGYRCAHYQQSADTMDLLDEHGFLVMAENRHFEPYPPYTDYLISHLRRDRNHPSVVLWSTSNEEALHIKPQGRIIHHKLATIIRRYTDTPVTAAVSSTPVNGTIYDDCDVIGMNYSVGMMDELAEKNPNHPLVLSECVASAATRGWYDNTDDVRGYMYGYDNRTYGFGDSLTHTEQLVRERPRYAGMFIWAGAEHRGEAYWPRLFSQAGMLDAALHFKDASWLLRSFWTETPMIHLLPHWNHAAGETVTVWAYTNCEEAELFVNGKSQGRVSCPGTKHGEWSVPFEAGELKAIGYKNGISAAEETVYTAGIPAKLELVLENRVPLDGKRRTAVVTCRILDAKGHIVPDADTEVSFSVRGKGKLLGTFGSVCDHKTATAHERQAFMGFVSVAVDVEGECEIIARSAVGCAAIRISREQVEA